MGPIFDTTRNLGRWLTSGAGLRPIGAPMASVPARSLPVFWET